MKRNNLVFLIAAALTFASWAQTPVDVAYGTLAAGPNAIVFIDKTNFILLNVAAGRSSVIPTAELGASGAIGYLTGTKWLIGKTSDAGIRRGDVFIFDALTGTAGPAIGNFTDVRDLAVIDRGNRLDAIIADRANDTVHLITDVLGTPALSEITPRSIAGNVGIQGLVALGDSLYFLYDEWPGGGFGNDELIVVEGLTPDAKTTRLSWNAIGSAGAGLNTDELSVDFHNGLAVRQPDPSTIVVYLSNFGVFSEAQIIEVKWVDSGNGFNFSTPISSVLFSEADLIEAIVDNNPDALVPEGMANSRGVAILPGDTPADDQLVIWVDDTVTDNTYMLLYNIVDRTFSLFGGDALERALETTAVQDRLPEKFSLLQNDPNPFNPATAIRFELPSVGIATLKIYDLNGRLVRTLLAGPKSAGEHTLVWDGRDDAGFAVAAGVYLYRLEFTAANGERLVQTQKMSLVK